MNQKSDSRQGGFVAMLGILVTMLIIAMLYVLEFSSLFGPMSGLKVNPYAERPWKEEHRLLNSKQFPVVQTGKDGKTVIEGRVLLQGKVRRKNAERGTIKIKIFPSGAISGKWSCRYEYPDNRYSIKADFSGNIDPKKTYKDAKGTRKKPLYLIAKGRYTQIKTDKTDGMVSKFSQTVYVAGWIEKDYSAHGSVFLMTGDGGNSEYRWKTTSEK